jgi:DNA-binding transcriptional MerR regulator
MTRAAERKPLRVGDLAKAVGKTVRAIHLYEELGLLAPVTRTTGGYRLYTEDAVARVNWIGKLQEMGFSLTEIQGFLRDWEGAGSGPEAMQRVRAVFQERLDETRRTMARLAALEKDLQASLDYLDSCAGCEPTHHKAECKCCDYHGHDPARAPELVAGLAGSRSERKPDVPLAHLTEGIR